ncbi:Hsp70 family protein [Nocardia carnea]|uniref:Hsp70 family protein n=1 Tax=Nocardia carnea TaxID=37328 RepID=UPI002454A869|nr:Hsp70 family protein [Nocardia carnea]
MTSGLGISIGTVNVVSARVGEHGTRPIVRTRRTAVGFDDRGSARLGGITRFSTALSEFADLGRDPESVYVDGRIWSPATIFASVVQGLVAAEPAPGVVATHPAGYSDKQLGLLRQSLDLAGAGHVQLVPEPVAAAQWLDTEHGPLDAGFVLVYDLGGNSLDIAVVRTGPDWPDHPVVGKPVRSYDFGGRPLGAMIARCAGDRAIGPAEPDTGTVSLMSFVDPEGLRREHIRDSLEVVRGAVRSAGVALSDIDRILVVGGAARPPQVAETLAELDIPVTIAADSAHCVALGAAAMAAESVPLAASSRAAHAPIFSGAAVFSAVAMSAATILGNGAADTVVPEPDRLPLQTPGAVLYEIHGEAQVERSGAGWSVSYAPLTTGPRIAPAGVSRPYGPPMPGPAVAPAPDRKGDRSDSHTSPRDRHADNRSPYSDPARFQNPIPFQRPDIPARPEPGPAEPETPGTELPGEPDPGDPPVLDPPGDRPGGETDEPEQGSDNGTGGVPGLPDIGSPGVPGVPGGNRPGGENSPGDGWSTPGGAGDSSSPGPEDDGTGTGNPGGVGAGDPGGVGTGGSGGVGSGDPGGVGTGDSGGYGAGDSGGYGTGDSGGYGTGDSGGLGPGGFGSGGSGMGDPGGFGSGGFGAGDSGGFGSGGFGAGDSGGYGGGGFGGGPGGFTSGKSDSSGGSHSDSGGFGGGFSSGRGGSDSGDSDSSKGSKSRGSESGGSSSSGSDGGSSRSKGSRGKSSGGKSSGGGSDN